MWFNMIIRVHVEGKEKNVLRYTVTYLERKIEREREHSSIRERHHELGSLNNFSSRASS